MAEICKYCSGVEPDFTDVDSLVHAIENEESKGVMLYRGEACIYPSSSPGTRRVLEDKNLTFEQKSFLIDAACIFQEWYEENMPKALDDCDMFLQHYGLPTDLLDFTESPRIAVHFAYKDLPSHIGRVGLLPVATAEHEGLELVRLRDFTIEGDTLRRPKKQQGWGIRHRPGHPSDFQNPTTCQRLGLEWHTFRKQLRDPQLFAGLEGILDSSDDRCAIRMRQWLKELTTATWQKSQLIQPLVDRIMRYL